MKVMKIKISSKHLVALSFIICQLSLSTTLVSCDKEDNPVEEPTVINVDDPQEEVTDQPALSRVK